MESRATGPDGKSGSRISRLAVPPADGSAAARWLGPTASGQTLVKTWSPDGTRILLCVRERGEVYAIDPVMGSAERVPGLSDLPDWQRVAR
jgi:hypothetical protein